MGSQGAPGAQAGAQGPQGPQGVQGQYGPQGVQGAAGVQGPQGRVGVTGSPASSAGISPTNILGVNVVVGPAGVQGPFGTVYASNLIVSGFSDARLKNIIGPIENALDKLNRIDGVYYEHNENATQNGYTSKGRHVGVLAQQVQEVLPEAIAPAPFDLDKYNNSISGNDYMTVRYERLIPLLIQALKEQKQQIETLKGLL